MKKITNFGNIYLQYICKLFTIRWNSWITKRKSNIKQNDGLHNKSHVNAGDSVKKGQLLYEIDPTRYVHNSDILKAKYKIL